MSKPQRAGARSNAQRCAGNRRALALAAILFAPTAASAGDPAPDTTESTDAPAETAGDAPADAAGAKPPPPAANAKPAETDDAKPKSVEVTGYVQPTFSVVYRGQAVPRDRWRYGAESTRAGIALDGEPVSRWHYHVEVLLAGETNDLVTAVEAVDQNGDGVPDDVSPTTERLPGLFIERAVIEFEASKQISIIAGQHRIPFTVQEQSPSTELMFPHRSGPNEVFVQGPDLGLEAVARLNDDLVIARLGVFNGTGEPVDVTSEHGLVFSARADINPLGAFPLSEANTAKGPARVGLGAGALYHESRSYDMAGFRGARERDLRASISFRAAIQGFYIQSELLRRQRTDSLSNRPEITTGAYAQGSYFLSGAIGLAPQARVGWAAEDQGFQGRTTVWFEGGVALFPSVEDPSAIKIVVGYRGERRITEGEQAHGAAVQAQLTW